MSSSSPLSVISDMTETMGCTMDNTSKHNDCAKESAEVAADVPTTPISVDGNTPRGKTWPTELLDDEVLGDLMKNEVVGPFLSNRDIFENDCYAYLGSVIGSSDLMSNIMLLYRGHVGFLIVSKATKKTWVSGAIEHNGFFLQFHRSNEKECKKLNGKYNELHNILLEEAVYRLNEIVNMT